MAEGSNLPMLGLGGAFVAACVAAGVLINGEDTGAAAGPTGRLVAADLDTATSQISRAEQASVARVCNSMMTRRKTQQAFAAARPSDEALEDYCTCIAQGGARELSRFQFLVMEESLRVFAKGGVSLFSKDDRARSSEITRLGREAANLGLSRAEIEQRVEHANGLMNRIARNCAAEMPPPKSSSEQRQERRKSRS